jgi:arylformamidase
LNATVDYEVEYNNRARVPEHQQIFDRWMRDAAAYRAEATGEGRCQLGLAYGPGARRTIDLFSPPNSAPTPLALFIHGGYWASLEPARFSHVARGLNARGVSVAVAGYDLCPAVTVADIVDQMRQASLYLLATDWKALAPDAPADLVPAAYAISGVFDLGPLVHVAMNQNLRLTEEEARRVSPVHWPVAPGRVLDAVVGGLESNEFLRQSRIIVDAWKAALAETRYEEVPGTNHFTIVDALENPASAMVERLAVLAARTRS